MIETDLLITVKESITVKYIELMLLNDFPLDSLTISVNEADDSPKVKDEWMKSNSLLVLHLTDMFVKNHFMNQSDDLKTFLTKIEVFLEPISKIKKAVSNANINLGSIPYSLFSVCYSDSDLTLEFLFDFDNDVQNYIQALELVFDSVKQYIDNTSDFRNEVKNSYENLNKIKYLVLRDGKWSIFSPPHEFVKEKNLAYRKNRDYRIKKPTVLLNRSNFYKNWVLDENWVLVFDDLETLMIKPNDVSIYSSIVDKKILKATEFYEDKIKPRFQNYLGGFPSFNLQSEYYDYFELIISAIIFSHTALETFANIFIPDQFIYNDDQGIERTHLRNKIEKTYSLERKFTKIFRVNFDTPDPKTENWWKKFEKLKDIRDEIIHTKQSKSEDRYSKLLSQNIFELLSVYKEIILYYGYYIQKNKPELMDEFPYNFGFDDLFPSFMTDEAYKNSERAISNISF